MKAKALNFMMFSALLLVAACGSNNQQGNIEGAGATFPAPLYLKLFADYAQETKSLVSYQAIGSGAGIQDIVKGIVDFGASDAPLSDEEIAEYKAQNIELLHIPGALAAVNFTYNIPGFGINEAAINLDAEVIYGMYTGDIMMWNDKRIQNLNPGVELPAIEVIPVYRSDSSGTTYTVTDFLNKASKGWAETFGLGKTITWIAGVGQKGNSAMMNFVKENVGSIAYVDVVYTAQNNFPVAKMKNKAGNFIAGDVSTTATVVENLKIPADARLSITYADGATAPSMAAFSYLLVRKEQNYNNRSLAKAQELVKLLLWMNKAENQAKHAEVFFTPLPAQVTALQVDMINQITYNGTPVINTITGATPVTTEVVAE
ncbi:MAG: phosphate ABC transporter substrate-binding protein PstS [Brevinema sp.]